MGACTKLLLLRTTALVGYHAAGFRFDQSSFKNGNYIFNYEKHGADWLFGSCGSHDSQSPIDIPGVSVRAINPVGTGSATAGSDTGTASVPVASAPAPGDTEPLSYSYQAITNAFKLENNGHTLAANFEGYGYGGVTYNSTWYSLVSLNFHSESEHTWGGQHFPVEVHLVHKKPTSDDLLVVAISFQKGGEAGADKLASFVPQQIPERGTEVMVTASAEKQLDLGGFYSGKLLFQNKI